MITIDEAIQRCWEIANVDFEEAKGMDKRYFGQISNWLEELKEITDSKDSGYNIGYTKAVDDFAEALKKRYPIMENDLFTVNDVLQKEIDRIAEQLKEGSADNE